MEAGRSFAGCKCGPCAVLPASIIGSQLHLHHPPLLIGALFQFERAISLSFSPPRMSLPQASYQIFLFDPLVNYNSRPTYALKFPYLLKHISKGRENRNLVVSKYDNICSSMGATTLSCLQLPSSFTGIYKFMAPAVYILPKQQIISHI